MGAFNDDLPGLVAAELRREDGQAIREAYLKSKGKAKVVFPGKPTPFYAKEKIPGSPAYFSSVGTCEYEQRGRSFCSAALICYLLSEPTISLARGPEA